ncbi:MAG: hypothetical protein QXX38_02855 [Candidatus Aenigmatarchaeota archaeon]
MNDILDQENFKEEIQRIVEHTKDEKLVDLVRKVIERFIVFDRELGTGLTRDAVEYISATAEETKDVNLVKSAINYFLLDEIVHIIEKYKRNKLNVSEIFSSIGANIHRLLTVSCSSQKQYEENFIKYLNWLGNGFISRFLNFVADFPYNGCTPLQQEVFSILNINLSKIDLFLQNSMKVYRKKIPIEKKIILISLLTRVCLVDKEGYIESILTSDLKKLKNIVEDELNLKLPNNYSLVCGISFIKDMDKDPNIRFIYEKTVEYKDFGKWFEHDDVTRSVINALEKNGFNPKIFVNSGKIISQKKADGGFSDNWVDVFKNIVIKILGSKKNEMLPKISIPNHSPGSIYKRIKNEYILAINGDKEAAKKVLLDLSQIIKNSYQRKKIPQSVNKTLLDIEMAIYMIDSGLVINYRGAKLTARVWRRKVPQDLYDVNKLWCCWFLPQNEDEEIALFFIDPKTTLLQFYVQGIENPIAVAFLYAGKVGNENAVLLDTWEGGPFTYVSLGQEKMFEFVLNSLIKFTKKCGGKKLVIHSYPKYTRAKEFGNFLRDKKFKIEKVFFEAIDSEDTVLQKYSKTRKHHLTNAFGVGPLKGEIDAFVFDC